MNIAILGLGIEGKSAEQYFTKHGYKTTIFDHFTPEELPKLPLRNFDLILRSPSVPPPKPTPKNWSSATNYFFQHCPAPIIAITGTKGKGTVATITDHLLKNLGKTTHLVGNIGTPALSILDQIKPSDIVVFELSSFQAWDLKTSPHIATILRIEPDHLNVHTDFDDYLAAKSHITTHQSKHDFLIYNHKNPHAKNLSRLTKAKTIAFPPKNPATKALLTKIAKHTSLIGAHNQENAALAILSIYPLFSNRLSHFLYTHQNTLIAALSSLPQLPHRLQLIKTLNCIKFYDDNFSSAFPSLDVALSALQSHPTFLIAGGKNRNLDLKDTKKRLQTAKNLQKIILIGETAPILSQNNPKSQIASSLKEAISLAYQAALSYKSSHPQSEPVVLMSPGAASFDMFIDFKDRGNQFQKLVKELK